MTELKNTLTYADSGVDIDAGNALVEHIKPLAKRTERAGVMSGLGGFGGFFDLHAAGFTDPILVSATDGVGTKLRLAIESGDLSTVGIDLVAMCVNDLICQGAEPLLFLDYYATGRLDVERATQVIAGIVKGCEEAGAALIGGETAEMPGMYAGDDFDLAGFAVGALERGAQLPRMAQEGDRLLGLASSGVHSNGFSLVRKILELTGQGIEDQTPFGGSTFAQTLLCPTRIYVKSCLKAAKEHDIRAFAHITGGGLTENIPRVLPQGMGIEIDLKAWTRPALFQWLQSAGGVADREMLKTFNCGIGMVVVTPQDAAEEVAQSLRDSGEEVFDIGAVTASGAVLYKGQF